MLPLCISKAQRCTNMILVIFTNGRKLITCEKFKLAWVKDSLFSIFAFCFLSVMVLLVG